MVIIMRKFLFLCVMMLWSGCAFAASYAMIDKYALNAPQVKSEKEIDALMEYLVKPFHNDIEKARAIFAWIVYNIDYDEYRAGLMKNPHLRQRLSQLPTPEHILKTRLGVCEDIANLYQELAAKAGLNVQAVDGWTNTDPRMLKKAEIGHRWLVINVAGSWEYLDPTWAMGQTSRGVFSDVSGNGRYKTEIFKRIKSKKNYEPRSERRVYDTWFLTDKDEMIKTHFPMQEQWQLQKDKVTREEFFGQKSKKGKKK